MVRVACLLFLLSLVGCSGPAQLEPALAAGSGTVASAGVAEPVRLWQDAAIFTLVRRLITSAHHRVLVEMYELGRGDIEQGLAVAMRRRVSVRVITDPTVQASRQSASVLDAMGVPERAYPVDDAAHQIDHVKLLVADGEAVVGGMNWGAHSDRNHDYALETRVPAELDRVTRIFDQDWSLAGGDPSPLATAGGEIAQTAPGGEIRAMLESALNAANRRVLVEIYTLTDPEVIAGLVAAHRRGATVRVVMDPNQAYNLHAYSMLVSNGVEARWYPIPRGALLHAKIGLFDGVLVLGSANWSRSGLGVNHELDVETQDPSAVAAFGSRFDWDWARSRAA